MWGLTLLTPVLGHIIVLTDTSARGYYWTYWHKCWRLLLHSRTLVLGVITSTHTSFEGYFCTYTNAVGYSTLTSVCISIPCRTYILSAKLRCQCEALWGCWGSHLRYSMLFELTTTALYCRDLRMGVAELFSKKIMGWCWQHSAPKNAVCFQQLTTGITSCSSGRSTDILLCLQGVWRDKTSGKCAYIAEMYYICLVSLVCCLDILYTLRKNLINHFCSTVVMQRFFFFLFVCIVFFFFAVF